MIALLDNTVLSNFAVIARPMLVWMALGEEAATVEEPFAELQAGIQCGRLPSSDWSWLPILHLREPDRTLYGHLRMHLGAGEAACLALAYAEGYRVFTDDRDAREIAMQMRVPVSGTLGLLVRLMDRGDLSLPEADRLLAEMIAAGYRCPVASLSEIG